MSTEIRTTEGNTRPAIWAVVRGASGDTVGPGGDVGVGVGVCVGGVGTGVDGPTVIVGVGATAVWEGKTNGVGVGGNVIGVGVGGNAIGVGVGGKVIAVGVGGKVIAVGVGGKVMAVGVGAAEVQATATSNAAEMAAKASLPLRLSRLLKLIIGLPGLAPPVR